MPSSTEREYWKEREGERDRRGDYFPAIRCTAGRKDDQSHSFFCRPCDRRYGKFAGPAIRASYRFLISFTSSSTNRNQHECSDNRDLEDKITHYRVKTRKRFFTNLYTYIIIHLKRTRDILINVNVSRITKNYEENKKKKPRYFSRNTFSER